MYPDDGSGGGAEMSSMPMSSKIGINLEGLIPLILILVIAFFLGTRLGFIDSNTPVLGFVASFAGGSETAKMLLIGNSSPEALTVLYELDGDLIKLTQRTADSLDRNPAEILANYDIVMLDQSHQVNKSVSRKLGEAIEGYVLKGGKLITVMDSGIYQPGAFDIVGWKATFGNIVPVNCERIYQGEPTCMMRLNIRGKLYRVAETHRIMRGIDQFPVLPNQLSNFETFDVGLDGTEIAFLRDETGIGKTFPGIVEKRLLIGKSIYFNFNPGYSKGIFTNTIEYLTGR